MREDYRAKVTKSYVELTAREKISLKDFESAIKLNDVITNEDGITLKVTNMACVEVHNEHSKQNTDYSVYIFMTEDGKRYRTGSSSMYESACDIFDELIEYGEDTSSVELVAYKVPSKNFDGDFIKCRLA